MNSNEEIPYLSPATAPADDQTIDNDEGDYRTLIEVQKILTQGIANLAKDFNAFDLAKTGEINLTAQIMGRQVASEFLEPIKDMVDSAIKAVEDSRKR